MMLVLSPLQALNTTVEHSPFTDEEKAWIAQHPVINFTGDPNWLPFEGFAKDGRYIGIISDVLNIIKQQTSLKFNIIPTKTWSESVSMLEKGKVDMMTVSDAWKDPNYLYTKSMLPSPIVIVAKEDHPYVDSTYYLQYESIAIIKGYRYTDEIRKKYPDYIFYEVKNIQEGLEGVASGKYDVLLASMALATYTIDNLQLYNVKVVGKTEYKIKVSFAVRKEFKPLVGIINKVYIGEKRIHDLLKEWTYQKYVEKTDYGFIAELIMLLLVILMAAVILYLLYKKKTRAHKSSEIVISDTQGEIDDAIKYASLLDKPSALKPANLKDFFDDSFNITHPKNIKSSTFVYFGTYGYGKALLMVIDANGNSVDGIINLMFIKRLISSLIEQVENETLDADPSKILRLMGSRIQKTIEGMEEKTKPGNIGFDAAVVSIDKADNTLTYAGANIPLFYTHGNEVSILRANKQRVENGDYEFADHTVKIHDTMDFYILSRAFIDQVGGDQELPFGKRRIKEILGRYSSHNMDTQKNTLTKAFMEHTGRHPRVGDITIVGFRVTEE